MCTKPLLLFKIVWTDIFNSSSFRTKPYFFRRTFWWLIFSYLLSINDYIVHNLAIQSWHQKSSENQPNSFIFIWLMLDKCNVYIEVVFCPNFRWYPWIFSSNTQVFAKKEIPPPVYRGRFTVLLIDVLVFNLDETVSVGFRQSWRSE